MGERKPYVWTAPAVGHHAALAPRLSLEAWRRAGKSDTRAHVLEAWHQSGYCIDAPDEMPAGACRIFYADEVGILPEQLTVQREPT